MQENNQVSAPVTPVVEPQVVVEQPKQSNFLAILLSILLFISVSIAGFFAYQTQKLVKELTLLRTQPTPVTTIEPVVTEVSEVDPTANWKTYKSKNFSFKLPTSILIQSGDLNNGFAQFKSDKYNLTLDLGGHGFGVECVDKIKTESLVIDNLPVTKTVYQGMSKINEMCDVPTDNEFHYWIRLNPKADENFQDTFAFSFSTKKVSIQEANTLFDQILSTFKFTN